MSPWLPPNSRPGRPGGVCGATRSQFRLANGGSGTRRLRAPTTPRARSSATPQAACFIRPAARTLTARTARPVSTRLTQRGPRATDRPAIASTDRPYRSPWSAIDMIDIGSRARDDYAAWAVRLHDDNPGACSYDLAGAFRRLGRIGTAGGLEFQCASRPSLGREPSG